MVSRSNIGFSTIIVFRSDSKSKLEQTRALKGPADSPYFLSLDISISELPGKTVKVAKTPIKIRKQIIENEYMVAECDFELAWAGSSDSIIQKKEEINEGIWQLLKAEYKVDEGLYEVYTVIKINGDLNQKPRDYVEKNKYLFSRLIRGLNKKISDEQADEILMTKSSYANNDLTIIDWEGALLVDYENNFSEDIELIKLGNYQLLRYRIIDQNITTTLEKLRDQVRGRKSKLGMLSKSILKSTIDQQLRLLLDFEQIDQSLMLIGDWYSAGVYRQIDAELYLNEWRKIVKNKLNTLREVDDVVRQNIALSWDRIWNQIQIIGWLTILIGYLFLLVKDLGWI